MVAASAAAGSLAGTGAVSLANNRGDLGDTFSDTFSSDGLRSAAIAAVSAGLIKGVIGNNVSTSTGATTGLDLSQVGDIARFAGQRATQAAIDAGVRTAIEGGSLSDNLEDGFENAVAHVVSGVLFNAVGDVSQGRFDNGSPEKMALHALAGGLSAEAMGGDFRTGALAAGANEALVEHLDAILGSDPEMRELLLVTASQLVGIVAAELTDGDVHQGAEIAAQGTRYNYLSHDQLSTAQAELAACEGDSSCMADVVERYQAISQEQNQAALEACSTDLAACQDHSLAAANGEYARYGDDALWDLSTEALPYMQALFDENIGVQNQFGEATIARSLMEGAGLSPEVAAVLAAMPVGINIKGKGQLSVQDLSVSASVSDRGGLSAAGRALQKHGDRLGSAFPAIRGRPEEINKQGQDIVDSILTSPNSTLTERHHARYGNVVEIRDADGRGLRFDARGRFLGLLEPR